MHIEDRSNQWYSYAGYIAGRASDVMLDTGTQAPAWAIDGWIAAPFHRFPLLNLHLESVAYGSFCEGGVCAAAINTQSGALSEGQQLRRSIMSGAPITGESEARGGGWGTRYAKPIMFPPDGSTVDLLSLEGEWPDPAKSCPGYAQPVGLPITIQFSWYLTPRINGAALLENGHQVHICVFDATNYVNPDPTTEKLARAGLEDAGAIMIVPQKPLLPSAKYTVYAVVDEAKYAWSFATSPANTSKR